MTSSTHHETQLSFHLTQFQPSVQLKDFLQKYIVARAGMVARGRSRDGPREILGFSARTGGLPSLGVVQDLGVVPMGVGAVGGLAELELRPHALPGEERSHVVLEQVADLLVGELGVDARLVEEMRQDWLQWGREHGYDC